MNKNILGHTYSIKEVSKKMNIPIGTIRQWEKDLKGILVIPRGENNARYFTVKEIELLKKIKEMRKNNVSKDLIRTRLMEHVLEQKSKEKPSWSREISLKKATISRKPLMEKEQTHEISSAKPQATIEEFFAALEQYKLDFLKEIKDAVESNQAEVMDEMKKEITSSSLHTIKQVSKSIRRANEKRKDELRNVSNSVQQASEQTAQSFTALTDTIKNDSKIGYDRLSQKLSETTKTNTRENKNFYLRVTKAVTEAKDSINKATDSLDEKQQILLKRMNEIKTSTEEIQEREEVFQDMLNTFREAAAAKSEKKKWWQFWSK